MEKLTTENENKIEKALFNFFMLADLLCNADKECPVLHSMTFLTIGKFLNENAEIIKNATGVEC